MWPAIIGAGALALLIKELLNDSEDVKKRIFISFAIEDKKYRDFLVAQAKNEKTPFAFVDMSVKKPWDPKVWRQKCRTKIRSCDGVIVLISKNTMQSTGARWEIKCAREEGVPIVGLHVKKEDRGKTPPELKGKTVVVWSWDNLERVIDSFK
jgi:hypothetical protein